MYDGAGRDDMVLVLSAVSLRNGEAIPCYDLYSL